MMSLSSREAELYERYWLGAWDRKEIVGHQQTQ